MSIDEWERAQQEKWDRIFGKKQNILTNANAGGNLVSTATNKGVK